MSRDPIEEAVSMQAARERKPVESGRPATVAGELLVRNLCRPRELVRKLVIGDAIGERPKAGRGR